MRFSKFLFLIIGLVIQTSVFAQMYTPSDSIVNNNITDSVSTRQVYCLLLGKSTNVLGLGSKCTVEVDFGEGQSVWRGGVDNTLVDDKGKPIKFNSMIDALNFMTQYGWEFVNAYAITLPSNQHVYHWLLKKDVSIFETGREGINQIRNKKKKRKKDNEDDKYDPIYK